MAAATRRVTDRLATGMGSRGAQGAGGLTRPYLTRLWDVVTRSPRRVLLSAAFVALASVSTLLAGPNTSRAGAVEAPPNVAITAPSSPVSVSASAMTAPDVFLETFDGAPGAPQPYTNPHGWDITTTGIDSRQAGATVQVAHHGAMCGAPGFPYSAGNTHAIASNSDQVFICNNHLMTVNGLTGYGAIYMTPPATADFSAGVARISFEMSTLRTAARDWVYFTLTPFEGHNKFAYNNQDQDPPADNINIKLAGTNVMLATQRVRGGGDVALGGDGFTTWDMVQAASGFSEDAARRDSFLIELSATHLRVCLTGNSAGATYSYQGHTPFCWIDSDLPTPLDPAVWSNQAAFMMTHVTYNAEKSCSSEEDQFYIVHNPTGDAQCPPDTWHWDNVRIDPARPFTILNPVQRFAEFTDPSGANTVTFAQPAPPGARLSYIAAGDCTQQRFSTDGGASWISAAPQPTATQCQHPENGGEYWTPIPAGTTSVKFTGQRTFGVWSAGGIAIWANAGGTLPIVTTTPATAPVVTPTTSLHSAWVDQTAYPVLHPGASATITMHFRNTGADTWHTGVPGRQVNLAVAGDSTAFSALGMADGWLTANRLTTTAETSVAPGQVGTFTFRIRAPQEPGRYVVPLRLVADGTAWLDDQGVYLLVTSDLGYHSAWVSQSAWPTLHVGELSAPLTIVFRNTGDQSWDRGSARQVNLGVSNDDTSFASLAAGWPSADRVAVQTEVGVAPGANGTFTFQVRAPAAPGVYRIPLRPVVDGVTWLDDQGVFVQLTVVP